MVGRCHAWTPPLLTRTETAQAQSSQVAPCCSQSNPRGRGQRTAEPGYVSPPEPVPPGYLSQQARW